MEFMYGLEDRPPFWKSMLVALQWCAVTLPLVVIFGKIAGGFHLLDIGDQIVYLQKITLIVGLFLFLQNPMGAPPAPDPRPFIGDPYRGHLKFGT